MRVSTRTTVLAAMMMSAAALLRGQSDVAANGLPRGVPTPVLRLNLYTQAVPTFECTPDDGCAVTALVVIRTFPMPQSVVLFDSTDQAAHVGNILRLSDESWRLQFEDGSQRTEFTFSIDSVQFVFGYDPRTEFGNAGWSSAPRGQMYARAEIRDSAVLAAIRHARSLRVLALAPSASSSGKQSVWLRDTTRWLHRVQKAEQSLTAAKQAGPAERRNAGAAQI